MSVREAKRLKELGFDTVTTELGDPTNRHNAGRVSISKSPNTKGSDYVDLKVSNKYGLAIELHRIEAGKLISLLESMQL